MTSLSGYDNRCVLRDAGGYVLRRINEEYFAEVTRIFEVYVANKLCTCGIVATEIDKASATLVHHKHTISYPYEWTASMYKDAVLFHLGLYLELEKYGLTLKDALPNNIVFHNCVPVFVDFTSIVFAEKLVEEEWLVEEAQHLDPRFAVADRMLTPYMLIPFAAMMNKDYASARSMLSDRACNCGSPAPAWKELRHGVLSAIAAGVPGRVLGRLAGLVIPESDKRIAELRKLLGNHRLPFIDFIRRLSEFVAVADVTPPRSAYLSYYESKKENFNHEDPSSWNNKQRSLCTILNSCQPATVLDIGANTGWFSILAARSGARVIATDIDESSIDSLYLHAKAKRLPILSLAMSFDDYTREIYGVDDKNPLYAGRNFNDIPLYLPATRRLQSDMVLCLGLVHHLVLGMGKDIDDVMRILALMARKCLVIEFVAIDDKLVRDDPSFFKNIGNYSEESYNFSKLVEVSRRFFRQVRVYESDSPTRSILLLEDPLSVVEGPGHLCAGVRRCEAE